MKILTSGRGEGRARRRLAARVCQLLEAYKGLRWLEALKQQEKQLHSGPQPGSPTANAYSAATLHFCWRVCVCVCVPVISPADIYLFSIRIRLPSLLKMQKLLHNLFMTSEIFVQCSFFFHSLSLTHSFSVSLSQLLLLLPYSAVSALMPS